MRAETETDLREDAMRAMEHFLQMVEEHEGTDSSRVAERLICAVAFGEYTFRLPSLRRFDVNNYTRAMSVIAYAGKRSVVFSDWLMAHHRGQVLSLIEKNRAAFESEARELLRCLK